MTPIHAIDDARKQRKVRSRDGTDGKTREHNYESEDGYPRSTAFLIYGAYPLLLIVLALLAAAIAAIRYFFW